MSIVNRICEKYRADYHLIFDIMMRPIDLTYGTSVPGELRDKIQNGMDRMNVYSEEGGIPLSLDMTPEGIYTLSRSGELLFKFANRAAQFVFSNYDVSDAILWTIYAIAAQKDWLRGEEGRYISCRCFSARQQAAAARIMRSVRAQYVSSVSEEKVSQALERISGKIDDLVESVPLFSARPICEDAYKTFHGRVVEMELDGIAERLFGKTPFVNEVDAYQKMIKTDGTYRKRLDATRDMLINLVYELPIMAVGYFFTELSARIDGIDAGTPEQIEQSLWKKDRFSLTPENLRECFSEVDACYRHYSKVTLQQDFLRTVCEEAQNVISAELTSAQKVVGELFRNLGRFCFAENIRFGQKADSDLLGWRQLAHLEDSDIFSTDVSWDADTLLVLQSTIHSRYAANAWICTERLKNQVTEKQITDQYNSVSAPLLDERCVWAIWADEIVR